MRGLFITLEGTEGAGKSTQLDLLAARIEACGRVVRRLREPGGTDVGEEIRMLLKRPRPAGAMAPETELLLMNASRAQLVREVIRPALGRLEVVLCDRFYDSTEAYQGHGRGLDRAWITRIVDFAVEGTRPDLTLLLEVPVELSEARRGSRRSEPAGVKTAKGAARAVGPDRFEQADRAFFERVEQGFRVIAAREPGRFRCVDGAGSPESVAQAIWAQVEPLLKGA